MKERKPAKGKRSEPKKSVVQGDKSTNTNLGPLKRSGALKPAKRIPVKKVTNGSLSQTSQIHQGHSMVNSLVPYSVSPTSSYTSELKTPDISSYKFSDNRRGFIGADGQGDQRREDVSNQNPGNICASSQKLSTSEYAVHEFPYMGHYKSQLTANKICGEKDLYTFTGEVTPYIPPKHQSVIAKAVGQSGIDTSQNWIVNSTR